MRHKLYAGTSGWAYSSWKPGFYPAGMGLAKFLEYYASRLNSVEVNYTFKATPTVKLLNGWMRDIPQDFTFAVKASEQITHRKRLRAATAITKTFLNRLEPLRAANRLGPVLFQLPPNLKCDPALIEDFLAGLHSPGKIAFEFRHRSWFNDNTYSLLAKANAALCLAESEDLETPCVNTADFSYLRLRKDEYPAARRKVVAKRVSELRKRGDVFLYYKHMDEPTAPLAAEELLKNLQ